MGGKKRFSRSGKGKRGRENSQNVFCPCMKLAKNHKYKNKPKVNPQVVSFRGKN